jgi:hypothetical protein
MERLMTWLLGGPLTGLPSTPEGNAKPRGGVLETGKGVGRVMGVDPFKTKALPYLSYLPYLF